MSMSEADSYLCELQELYFVVWFLQPWETHKLWEYVPVKHLENITSEYTGLISRVFVTVL